MAVLFTQSSVSDTSLTEIVSLILMLYILINLQFVCWADVLWIIDLQGLPLQNKIIGNLYSNGIY